MQRCIMYGYTFTSHRQQLSDLQISAENWLAVLVSFSVKLHLRDGGQTDERMTLGMECGAF